MATITEPSLTLTFLSGDLQTGHPSVQTIGEQHIVRRTVAFHQQLLSDLKSASNQVDLLLHGNCAAIEDIVATEGDIKAVLRDGSATLFTGYLSTNFTWTVTHSGRKALAITLEDTGTRLLGKAFIPGGKHLFNCSASAAIASICAAAGITVSASCIPIPHIVTSTVDGARSCRDILDRLVYELGHVYCFDALGELRLFKVDCTSTEDLPVLDRDDLAVVGGTAITLSKRIRQYKSARVSFTRLGAASDYLVYRNTTGRGEGHPYCYMKLDPGAHFDGTEVYAESGWEEAQADSLRKAALIEACNAASEGAIVGSNGIIAVSNVRMEFTAESGSVTASITAAGGPYLRIQVHNGGSLPYHVTRLDAYASIIHIRDTNIVRTAATAFEGESSDNLLTEELEFVHERSLAQAHANLLGQYHRHSNCRYTFFSERDIPPGSVVRLVDNAFSGLDVAVMVTARTFTDESPVRQYQAVGISAFDLEADAHLETIAGGSGDTVGAPGPPGEDAYQVQVVSEGGTTFRMGQPFSTTMVARVFKGGIEVTDSFADADFRWSRSSLDAHADEIWNSAHYSTGSKSLVVTQQDAVGRSNFFCTLLRRI
jgi:hypothetical protein